MCVGMFFALTSLAAKGADWVPPENPSPSKILQEAQQDAQNQNYADALAKHVWYHENALRIDPAQYGVRLSFALSYWISLGTKYPAAQKRFVEERDEAGKAVLKGKNSREKFHDYQSMNECLKEQQKTVDLFLELDKKSPKTATEVYSIAEPSLIQAKQFEACGRHLDPDKQLATLTKQYRQAAPKTEADKQKEAFTGYAKGILANKGATLVALLVVGGKKEKAAEVAASLKQLSDDAEVHQALDDAFEGKLPLQGS